jgi:hypothetical protein
MITTDLSSNGFESLSILSIKNHLILESSNTLGSPRPIEVLGGDLEPASNLLSVSENPSPKSMKLFFEDGGYKL